MIFDIRKSKEFVKSITLDENDLVLCFRQPTIQSGFTSHLLPISELEYSKEDNAFSCPDHKVMLIRGK